MTMVISVNAQTEYDPLYFNAKTDSVAPSLALSGKYLRESANWDFAFIGCAVAASGTIIATQIIGNDKENDEIKNVGYLCGGVLGAWATLSYLMKVRYKWKSGKCLELYGNGIRYSF